MKVLDIALRDMLRSFRSAFAVVFMFVVPLAIVSLIYFAMGGQRASSDEGFSLPQTRVQVVNLDKPAMQYGGFSAGETLVAFLQSDELADLLAVELAPDEASARAAVDRGETGVAVIIPADFTATVFEQGRGTAVITLYYDPTLSIGPGIVKAVIGQFIDSFAGAKIAVDTVAHQLDSQGLVADAATLQNVVDGYLAWVQSVATDGEGASPEIQLQGIGTEGEPTNLLTTITGGVTAAMMIFYVFFTGSATAQSIIKEEEEGTLKRLFTAPVRLSTILSGKILGTVITLIIQVVVLVMASALVFGIRWGRPLPIALASLGLITLSASFGIFIMSLVKQSNQLGIVYGGLMTITGMAGVFPAMMPAAPQSLKLASLAVPQGWAMRAWLQVMEGTGIGADMMVTLGVVFGLSAVFFATGVILFRRRFE